MTCPRTALTPARCRFQILSRFVREDDGLIRSVREDNILSRFIREDDGVSATEYAFLLAAVILIAVAAISSLGLKNRDIWTTVEQAMAAVL